MVIDYQNIHLTANGLFAPYGTHVKDTLVDPLAFAERVLEVRAELQTLPAPKLVTLAEVHVFRGSPSNAREPILYSVTQRHRAEWTRDARVQVTYRPLRYPADWGQRSCVERPREKGIDVMVALEVVQLAQFGRYDIVVLASHDTDLEPALEMAAGVGRVKVETAGWQGARRLRPSGRSLWHTALSGADFVKTRDRRCYDR
ncbi:NYN domain-containing protein [Streptosporangium sandarakinum]|uniref:NYN domain-containing protein n=1 Tax=Streptosporangium sandarakinum TaxID=1260955 RepID=A0A852V4A2_9ACTN|nr:NYN domain-containing protein [Streptosporangium sandarakinum]NYF42940.1 hypothetical protein [Streptosporangium sandarakinum]